MDRATASRKLEQLRPRGGAAGIRTQGVGTSDGDAVNPRPTFGLGLTAGSGPGDYQLAVLVQDERLMGTSQVDAVVEAVDGEAVVEFVGIPEAYESLDASQVTTARARPLTPGCSISTTTRKSAGTLGCFVKDDASTYLLSNSHVVADFGQSAPGVEVVQPGRLDGGSSPEDVVGSLTRLVPVDPRLLNLADAAIAEVDRAQVDQTIPGLGTLLGAPHELDIGDLVAKRGRTTGLTSGVVRSVNVNLKIRWPNELVEFADLVRIEATSPGSLFSEPGDSGSLVVHMPQIAPAGLHMAGGRGFSYATPIAIVLRELAVSML